MDGYCKIREACEYAGGFSARTLRSWRKRGLKCTRVGRELLFKYEWIDEFMEKHIQDQPDIRGIVDDVVRKIRKSGAGRI